jgi:exopolyphosphatase / guanosine-5'-triphosphate,3'-diphosphate pyrophosphatase
MRFAAIDVGSNAVRLLISEVSEKQNIIDFKKVLFIRVPLRLGICVFVERKIPKKKVTQLQKVMTSFKNLVDVYEVDDTMACATAAMREATNGKEVIRHIREKSGVKIDIIDGKREAEMIYANHIAEEFNDDRYYLYIDVGGGSTEVTLFSRGEALVTNSFPIGTIRLLYDKVADETWEEVKQWLKEHTADSSGNISGIGTGGNINKLHKLAGKKENKSISYQEIKEIYGYLDSLTIEDRIHKLGLNEDRADVIVPACRIFLCIMKWAGIDEVYVPRLGLADGIVHHLYEKHCILQEKS